MDILAEFNTLKDSHLKLEADYKAATELVEASTSELATVKQALADKDTAFAALTTEKEKLAADLQSIQAALEQFKAEKQTAEELAIEMVAKQGVAPIKNTPSDTNASTPDEARAQYAALLQKDSYEAGAFYKANRALILQRK